MIEENSPVELVRSWLRRRALLFNLLGLGALVLVLLIPLAMISGVLRERSQRQHEAVASIVEPWGRAQQLGGPLLVVPWTLRTPGVETVFIEGRPVTRPREEVRHGEAFVWPEALEVTAQLETSERRRGIFRTPVYVARVALRGRFDRAGLAAVWPAGATPQWDAARVALGLGDLRGAREVGALQWAGGEVLWEPGTRAAPLATGLHARVAMPEGSVEFATTLVLQGSDTFAVVPTARQTELRVNSAWPTPRFTGAFLPVERSMGAEGFEARWQVSHFARDLAGAWSSDAAEAAPAAQRLGELAVSVALRESVDGYRLVERALKHGVLTLVLVLAACFLGEVVTGLRVSGLHYVLVGAALCLFFLALLALTEVLPFPAAYAAAAAVATALIGGHTWSLLRSGRRALGIVAVLLAVYGYLYLVLQSEDYALLAGTAGLVVVLAATMAVVRRLGITDTPDALAADGREPRA